MPRLVALLVLASVGTAAAEGRLRGPGPGVDGLDYVVVEPAPVFFHHGGPHYLYLNRCVDGCTVESGRDDAVADRSSILGRGGIPSRVSVQPFGWDDATWDGMVACVRDTYAIYGVEVVTAPPGGPHVEVMVAGTADALALAGNTLGIAPLANDCSALPSAIGFAFANAHLAGPELVSELCATVAHEAGHVYGLDHAFECKDPMTYLTGCGRKVFLNRTLACGEFDGTRACKCGATQSSHRHLYDRLGPGALPAPAGLDIRSPLPATTVAPGFSVFVAVDGRPVTTVELWVNGALVGAVPGKVSTAPYELVTPVELFDGVLDLEVRVYDDLGTLATRTITVQKGAPCAGPAACPGGYTCSEGRCLAPAGTTAVGEACGGAAECASKACVARDGEPTCTQPCWPAASTCPDGLACLHADDERYACFAPDAGGCCSAGADPRGALALIALAAAMLGRRRRR